MPDEEGNGKCLPTGQYFSIGVMKILQNEAVAVVMQPMDKLQINELYSLTGKFMVHEKHVNK